MSVGNLVDWLIGIPASFAGRNKRSHSNCTCSHVNVRRHITGINPEAVKCGDDHYDRLLCPGLQPGPPSQTPGGLGQRYWSVSEVTWPPKLELRRWRSSGPSSLMRFVKTVNINFTDNLATFPITKPFWSYLKLLLICLLELGFGFDHSFPRDKTVRKSPYYRAFHRNANWSVKDSICHSRPDHHWFR